MTRTRKLAVAMATGAAMALAATGAQARSLYVPNYTLGTVSVIDTATNAVTKTITVSGGPWLAAITPNGKTVYVVQYSGGGLVPISVSTGTVGTPIPISGAADPYDLAISPDGTTAYVANYDGAITPIDLSSGTSGNPINVGGSGTDSYALTVSPNGQTVYVSDYGTSEVVPVSVSSGTAGTPISVDGAYYSAITPDGKTLWVIAYNDDELVPIDTATGTAGTGIHLTGVVDPYGVAISPDGKMAYVSDYGEDAVLPVNLSTRSVGLPIPTGGLNPWFESMTPDGKTVYVGNYDGGSVTPISTATNTAGTPVSTGSVDDEVGQLAIVPNQGPTAAFTHTVHGRKASINGSKSSDSDGTVAKYAWKFGDGSKKTTSSAKVTHSYSHPGHYHVTLTVTDNEGCSTSLVFTGQTAYCNGTKAAEVTHTVVIAKPRVRIETGSARITSGKVRIRIACIGGFRCKGTLTLRSGTTTVGSAHYSIAAGKTGTVTVRLTSAGTSAVAAAANHRLTTKATATVSGGTKGTRTVTLIGAPSFTG